MSTATGALRSFDPVPGREPVLRRRRNARAPRPFALVRGTARPRPERVAPPSVAPVDVAQQAAGPAVSRPAEEARSVLVRATTLAPARIEPPRDLVRTERRGRIFDLTDAEVDLAFATVPRSEPLPRPVVRPRPAGTSGRAPRSDRGPRGELALYGRGSVPTARPARGEHPLRRVERAQRGFAALAVTALATALIVVAFLGLAHLRAGGFGERVDAPIPGITEPADVPSRGLVPGQG
ncbi:hypothetical protein [Nocardia sp. AG03]|uniref:hypothetical protein n=1 Tax=Nocardia sp. AG03 TaxID=3025312 RepID=UPI0024184629|nr:hypothetical protein [Nocardia sp. AG03]